MTRLTLAGAIFLAVLAVLPMLIANTLQIPMITAQFFGGTSLLIMIGVMLDTMRQMETYLLQRHYDGFLKKGRIRSRSANAQSGALGDALELKAVGKLCAVVGSIFLFGIVIWAVRHPWSR
jgi:preprotein translocase subunit SecY